MRGASRRGANANGPNATPGAAGPGGGGGGPFPLLVSLLGAGGAGDELVRTVRLDLEDVELPVQRVVRLRRPAEGAAEEPVRDAHLLDLADHVAAFRELALAGAPR